MSSVISFKRLFFAVLLGTLLNVVFFNFPDKFVHVRLRPYVSDVNKTIKENCNPEALRTYLQTSINFNNDMSDNVLGSCSKGLLRWRIDINTKLWFYLSENDKHSLIHHELAHCVLGEEHEFAKTPHFMNESIEHLSYEELKSQFINVLNKHCKK